MSDFGRLLRQHQNISQPCSKIVGQTLQKDEDGQVDAGTGTVAGHGKRTEQGTRTDRFQRFRLIRLHGRGPSPGVADELRPGVLVIWWKMITMVTGFSGAPYPLQRAPSR